MLGRLEALARRVDRTQRFAMSRATNLELDTKARQARRARQAKWIQHSEFLLLVMRHAGQVDHRFAQPLIRTVLEAGYMIREPADGDTAWSPKGRSCIAGRGE
jgi:hypothetical protein